MENSRQLLVSEPDRPCRILAVDDDDLSRMFVKVQLKPFGYEVIEAGSGEQALEAFEREQPDLVLMDIVMPGMDGYEAARAIKSRSGDTYIPILFMTSISDESTIARCVDAGGDDFLPKPVTPIVLDARIRAALQRRGLYQKLHEQHEALQLRKAQDDRDQELAKEVFSHIAHLGCLDDAGINYIASSLMVFNGDMLLAARTPYGALRVMLGDFTGHGLPAAVGSLPAADTFYGMTAKGFHISEIVTEINKKLSRILPKGIFCAAAVLEINSATRQLSVWNGGLPELILYQNHPRKIIHSFESRHLALGILSAGDFDDHVVIHTLPEAAYLVAYTDGIIETENPAGELYGERRLRECIESGDAAQGMFRSIMDSVESFRQHAAQYDDYTLIEVPCSISNQNDSMEQGSTGPSKPAGTWDYNLTLKGSSLREVDPVPMVLNAITDLQGLQCAREDLFTVLTELYVNALDHGVLKLDSKLKHSADGFSEYFRLRERKLEDPGDDFISIQLSHAPQATGGRLTIRIEDSGNGFDEESILKQIAEQPLASGRGMLLIKSLCTKLSYSDGGRTAVAVYDWAS